MPPVVELAKLLITTEIRSECETMSKDLAHLDFLSHQDSATLGPLHLTFCMTDAKSEILAAKRP